MPFLLVYVDQSKYQQVCNTNRFPHNLSNLIFLLSKIKKGFSEFNLTNYAHACLVKAIAEITNREINTNLLLHFIKNKLNFSEVLFYG